MNKVISILIVLVSAHSMAESLTKSEQRLLDKDFPFKSTVCNSNAASLSTDFTHAIYQIKTSVSIQSDNTAKMGKILGLSKVLIESASTYAEIRDSKDPMAKSVFTGVMGDSIKRNLSLADMELNREARHLINLGSSTLFDQNGVEIDGRQRNYFKQAVHFFGATIRPSQSSACVEVEVNDPNGKEPTDDELAKLESGNKAVAAQIEKIREHSVKVDPDGAGFINGNGDPMQFVGANASK